jgi:hypothetical protein
MKQSSLCRRRGLGSAIVAMAIGVLGAEPGFAEELVSPRRTIGVALLGGSLLLAKKGLDLHRDADELYARYKKADRPEEASRLYRRTNNRDIKSQVSWALSAAFAISGARLLLRGRSASDLNKRSGGSWVFSGPAEVRGVDLGLARSWRFF